MPYGVGKNCMDRAHSVTQTTRSRTEIASRARVFEVLEAAGEGDTLSRCVDFLLVGLIIASVAAVNLESIPSIGRRYADTFYWLEVITVCFFSVEYVLRIWSCIDAPTRPAGESALRTRIKFAFSFHALIDLIAILPFFLVTGPGPSGLGQPTAARSMASAALHFSSEPSGQSRCRPFSR